MGEKMPMSPEELGANMEDTEFTTVQPNPKEEKTIEFTKEDDNLIAAANQLPPEGTPANGTQEIGVSEKTAKDISAPAHEPSPPSVNHAGNEEGLTQAMGDVVKGIAEETPDPFK